MTDAADEYTSSTYAIDESSFAGRATGGGGAADVTTDVSGLGNEPADMERFLGNDDLANCGMDGNGFTIFFGIVTIGAADESGVNTGAGPYCCSFLIARFSSLFA